jgi:hypothetical protein
MPANSARSDQAMQAIPRLNRQRQSPVTQTAHIQRNRSEISVSIIAMTWRCD